MLLTNNCVDGLMLKAGSSCLPNGIRRVTDLSQRPTRTKPSDVVSNPCSVRFAPICVVGASCSADTNVVAVITHHPLTASKTPSLPRSRQSGNRQRYTHLLTTMRDQSLCS